LTDRTASGAQELALIVAWRHRNGPWARCLARVHLPSPPTRPLVVLSEYAENPTGTGIVNDFAGAANALLGALPVGLVKPGEPRWLAHHGAFSYHDAQDAPETFTAVTLTWDGTRYRGDLGGQRMLSRAEADTMLADMRLAPVEELLARLDAGTYGDRNDDPGGERAWEAPWRGDDDPIGVWEDRLAFWESRGWHDLVERERRIGPPPEPGTSPYALAPVIVAVEVGRDPGGAIAVALAARRSELLRVVVVIGDAEASRFTRHLLDLLDRPDVAVVRGHAPAPPSTSIGRLVPAAVPAQSDDVMGAVRAVTSSTPYLVQWGNSGPLTDLGAVLAEDPGLADRLAVSIAVGPVDAPVPAFASDPAAAQVVLAAIRRPSNSARDPRAARRRMLLPDLITIDPALCTLAADADAPRRWASGAAPAWQQLLAAHLERWFARGEPAAALYPALTIGALLALDPFLPGHDHISADATGRVRSDPAGSEVESKGRLFPQLDGLDSWLARMLDQPPTGAGG
jgi:hypothetical protein